MLWGGLPILFGGVTPASYRIEQLKVLIADKDPDLILQEMSRSASSALWSKIKDRYAYAITSILPQPLTMMDAGLFIASKRSILQIHCVELRTNALMKRALVDLELSDVWVFTTHLAAGYDPEDKQTRQEQVSIICEEIERIKKSSGKPVVLMGDFNISRTFDAHDEYQSSGLSAFQCNNLDRVDKLDEMNATCTNILTHYVNNRGVLVCDKELVDYAFNSLVEATVEKVETYDVLKPLEALSDHKGLLVTLDLG